MDLNKTEARERLRSAIRDGNRELIEKLAPCNSDFNFRFKHGMTPLMLACATNSDPEVVEMLIELGADVHAFNSRKFTPLFWLCGVAEDQSARYAPEDPTSKRQKLDLLLNNGADIQRNDRFGRTPLHYAALKNHDAIVEQLLKEGADPNESDDDGMTPLHRACLHPGSMNHGTDLCPTEVIELLLNHDAKVNAQSDEGLTPLMCRITDSYFLEESLQILIDAGADVTLTDEQGNSALDLARESDNHELEQILESQGTE